MESSAGDSTANMSEVTASTAAPVPPLTKKKGNFVLPQLPLAQAQLLGGGPASQMTTREEQEQYKWKGMQDGKVEELIDHERRADQRKML